MNLVKSTHLVPQVLQNCIAGWWLTNPPLKMMEFVSWDDFPFPTEWKIINNVPNHQPDRVPVRVQATVLGVLSTAE